MHALRSAFDEIHQSRLGQSYYTTGPDPNFCIYIGMSILSGCEAYHMRRNLPYVMSTTCWLIHRGIEPSASWILTG